MGNEAGSETPTTEEAVAPAAPAANPPAATTDPAPATPATEGPKGQPDDAQKAARLENELAAAKQQAADLQTKLDAAKTADDVQKAVNEANAAAQAKVNEIAVRAHLATAGCLNAEALTAAAHIDASKVEVAQDGSVVSGIDLEKLKTDYPYLFQQVSASTPPTVTTAAAPAAPATGGEAKTIKEALAAMKKK